MRVPVQTVVGGGVIVQSSPPPPGQGATYGVPGVVVQGASPVTTLVRPVCVMDRQVSPLGPVMAGGDPGGFVNHRVRFEFTIEVVDVLDVAVQQVRETASMLTLPAPQVSAGDEFANPLVQVQP